MRPDRQRVQPLMSAMAIGDAAALFPFIELFGDSLAASVKFILRRIGRPEAARRQDDLDYLVQTAALVIFDRAKSWDPDRGALPWVWANRAIQAAIVKSLGQPSLERPDIEVSAEDQAPSAHPESDIDWYDLADRHGMVDVLLGALDHVATHRDSQVHLEYLAQRSLGDPSPANTVAAMFDLSPANVRQIDRRVRIKLGRLAVDDQSYAALRSLDWLAA